ncbi:hypothetical protein TIFTF001_002284 [Ficus carica]|uniref:SAM-dependent MTase RsmB/NOP-type domain-containing protein n=1 Tax=Ficus carica TaxID=3494 RepID=A0AA87Z5A5_FICCA|nr:hypothetical protein TIFTF001_002284 [Ficus carica]
MMEEETSMLPLPEAFVDFLEANGLDPSIYSATDSIPRYIRLKPGCEAEIEEVESEMECKLEKVDWLPGFYSLPNNIHIANSKAYREGKIYGIDAASGAAVSALNISAGDHVLDLCAAPVLDRRIESELRTENYAFGTLHWLVSVSLMVGAKLCMMLDLLGDSGSVTAVDVSRHRLAACRTMLQKYESGDRCRLFVADGTAFSLVPIRDHTDSRSCESASMENFERFKEWASRRTWKERKKAAQARENAAVNQENQQPELIFYGKLSGVVGLSKNELLQTVCDSEILSLGYDKVLVDAECTHDGSIKHIQKFEHWGWRTLQRRVLDAERTDSLTVLQLKLLTNGFRLLKAGGFLIYSTCRIAGDRRFEKLALQRRKDSKDFAF